MATMQWIGGPTVLLQLGTTRILTDPMFGEGPRAFIMSGHPSTGEERAEIARTAPLPAFDAETLDIVIVSHLHTDHFDPVAVERLRKSLRVIAPLDQVARLDGWGFTNVTGLKWGQEYLLQDERIIMKGVPAQHSADPDVNTDLEVVNGYMISYVEEGRSRRIYWTGDTVWFDGLSGIQADAGAIDLLIAHIGAVGDGGPWGRMTLDGSEAARLAKLFQPGTVIPIHHHTFSHYVEPVTVFEKAMDTAGTSIRTVVLSEGEEFKL